MPIIRRINCINTTSGICHMLQMTVWFSRTASHPPCTPNGHLHRVTYTRCRIDIINSPDDGQMAARNMSRIKLNIHENELCVKLVIYINLFFICINYVYLDARSTKHNYTPKRRNMLKYLLHSVTSQKIRILSISDMETLKPNDTLENNVLN
jgi:hypothetical protein